MKLRGPIVIAVVLTGHWLAASPGSPKPDPFDFLRPTIQFSADDKHQLDERGIVLKILPASGHELATMVAASLNTGPDAFVAKIRNMPALKKGPHVPQTEKFSASPAIEDLQHLSLDDSDIQTIEECRPNRCSLKLNADEIERLHRAQAAGTPAESNERVQREFRQVVLDRAKHYLAAGTVESKEQFQTLMQHSPFVLRVPQVVNYLERYPSAPLTGTESFLYWSKETYAWKPMVTVTHLTIIRTANGPLPEVLVISRDIFASRYTGGSLVVTALVRDPSLPETQRYVVYVNRTWVDGIRALWRPLVEYRVKSQAKKVFADVRERLERPGEQSTQ
jgi:hypothetical protein